MDKPTRADSASLADYLGILWRRRLTVLAAAIGVPIVAVALSSLQSAEYTASAAVLLRTENLAATLSGVPDPSFGQDPERLLDTQAKLARTPPVARSAAQRVGGGLTANELTSTTTVTFDPDADLLAFTAKAPSPERAIETANAYASAYTRYRTVLDAAPIRQALLTVNARLRDLRADGLTAIALYSTLLERQQELESIRALRSQSAVVVDPAQIAPQTRPRLMFAAMLGLAVGIFLGIAIAVLRDAMENRPRSADELERHLGLHVLGRIPSSREGATSLVTLTHPGSVDAEAYRLLRMNLEFAASMTEGSVFVVTSTVAEEGKSTVAANLAVALARVGRSVILVDGDPLRPVLRQRFQIRTSIPGLHDVITGRASLERALAEFSLPSMAGDERERFPRPAGDDRRLVQVLGAGDVREAPSRTGATAGSGRLRVLVADPTPVELSDFLVATKMEGLIAQLRGQAEIVLIDAPPMTTSVGMGVARLVDGLVVVANVRLMRRPMLDQLGGMLQELTVTKLGIVLTGLSADETATYGYPYRPREEPVMAPIASSSAKAKAEGRWSSASS